MVMGPTHSMSGAALGLLGIALWNLSFAPIDPAIALLGTIIIAGATLGPDIDSHSSTVVRSFGIFGRIAHMIVNSTSVFVYNITATKYDAPRSDGHRTLFHTIFMSIAMGALVAAATLPEGKITVFDHDFTWGQINAIIILSIFINLGLSGLFEKQVKKAKKMFGVYLMMLFSIITAIVIGFLLPSTSSDYYYLGIAVSLGWFIHLLGDGITKMGVPMFWPIKIKGKRWYDITLPSFMRIKADGPFEKIILLPGLTLMTIVLLIYNIITYIK